MINDDRLINVIAKATRDDSEPEECPYTGDQMARGEHLISHPDYAEKLYLALKPSDQMQQLENLRKLQNEY